MLVAAWTVHRENGFFIVGNGWEYNFILAIVAVGVAVTGGGTLSLDDALGPHTLGGGCPGLLLAVGAGVGGGPRRRGTGLRPPAPAHAPAPAAHFPPRGHVQGA